MSKRCRQNILCRARRGRGCLRGAVVVVLHFRCLRIALSSAEALRGVSTNSLRIQSFISPPGRPSTKPNGMYVSYFHASYFHASPNQLSICTTSHTPHTYTSDPHSLSSRSSQASPPRLPTRTHAPTVFHTHPDDPFFLSPTSSNRSCRSLTYQHPSNQSTLHSTFSSSTTQSSSSSQAPYLPLPASYTTQALPLSSDSHPSFASRVQPSQALSSQSSTAHSSPPVSLSHHTYSPLAPAFASEVPHSYYSIHTASIYPSTFATSSYPSSTTLSLGSQTVTHSPHTLAQSSLATF